MKKLVFLFVVFSCSIIPLISQSYEISTIAGNGTSGYSGDDGVATLAELSSPAGVTVDALGNVYIADQSNQRICIVNTSGIISTIAGNRVLGYYGDGGQATAAEFAFPTGVAVDDSGNLYIADANNNVIRKVFKNGIITTIAGNGFGEGSGLGGYFGDGGAATLAELSFACGVALDGVGNIYIADYQNNRIRMVNTIGIISTIVGNGSGGYFGDDGFATSASLSSPYGVAVDRQGNVYIADYLNDRIRKVNTSGIISTIAGDSSYGFSGDGGMATSAELYEPHAVVVDNFLNVYIPDFSNSRIRKVNSSGIISTIAGNGFMGFSGDGGSAILSELSTPFGISLDSSGNVYIGDWFNHRVRKLTRITTGIDEITLQGAQYEGVNIYPNPSNGKFTIDMLETPCMASLQVYDIMGQEIFTEVLPQTAKGALINIDLSNNPDGVYLYRVIDAKGNLTGEGKLVIAK